MTQNINEVVHVRIVGIYSHEPVAAELYDSLIHLQHRGQDAGMLT